MVMAHFLKREYESLFVHRYSHGTMPFAYVFRKYVTAESYLGYQLVLTRGPQFLSLPCSRGCSTRVCSLQSNVLSLLTVHPGYYP